MRARFFKLPSFVGVVLVCGFVAGACGSSSGEGSPQDEVRSTNSPAPASAQESAPSSSPAGTGATATFDDWFNGMERQSGPPPEMLGKTAGQWWRTVTGLEGPTSNDAWHERLERACAAPIWEHSAAAALADELIVADGGEPDGPAAIAEGRSLQEEAISVLWVMVNNGDWCAASFPLASLNVETWRNTTGLRGPTNLDVWNARLDRACAISDDDSDEWRRLAAELVEADGGDSADAARLDADVHSLQLMLRQAVMGRGPDGEPTPERRRTVHECP